MNVKFSVITVCYNAENLIRGTIESVLKQKWDNFEYIVIDGASTDETKEIVDEYVKSENRMICYSKKDKGIFNAMNKGIQYASGDFIIFLNAGDDFHDDGVLRKAAKEIISTNADILVGDVAFKTESGLLKHVYPVGAELYKDLSSGNCICHQVVFASKESLNSGFDEYFSTCADYDWICRQVILGRKIVKLDTIVVNYDIHGITGQVNYQKIHWKEYFEIIERYFPQPEFRFGREVKELYLLERKEYFLCKFMNRWLTLKQKGISLDEFFIQKKIQTIAIYGTHYIGKRLYDEFQGSSIKVAYAIDRNLCDKGWNIPVFHPDNELENVDAVVVTPIFDFLEIRDILSMKFDCPIFSIENILYYEY